MALRWIAESRVTFVEHNRRSKPVKMTAAHSRMASQHELRGFQQVPMDSAHRHSIWNSEISFEQGRGHFTHKDQNQASKQNAGR